MKEYFIVANSFAAPFVSDQSLSYIKDVDASHALTQFRANYKHPCGLYAVNVYNNADDYHKDKKPLCQWFCNEAKKRESRRDQPKKCIKCGHTKASTEFYRMAGNTCKECAKDAQKVRIVQKRLANEEGAEDNMEQRLRYNYTRVDAWSNGVQVMRKGVLVGKTGNTWWCDKLVRHKAWLRRKRMKEEVQC